MWRLLFILWFAAVEACTAFQLKSQDGAVIYCRSMEFGIPMDSNFLIVPRGNRYSGTAPNNNPGLHWKSKYGFAGMNQSAERTLVCDGMNEKGLVVGCLYLPGFAEYEAPDPAQKEKTLGAWELPSFLLSTCATVDEVKAIMETILVAQQPTPQLKMNTFILPLHFYVGDQSGSAIVIEFVDGKQHIYENPTGVLTNSPSFDWHLTNLTNYINLSPINTPPMNLNGWRIQNFSQGSGMIGMPGDPTPVARFIRAALFAKWATQPPTAEETVVLGFHMLNTFDLFQGMIRKSADENSDLTEWVIVHDRTNLRSYFRSYNSLRIQMVDLNKVDFNQSGMRQIPLNQVFQFDDVTNQAKGL